MSAQTPKPIFVLNGPNLNLLGTREPDIYGTQNLADVEAACVARAAKFGATIVFHQSNHEGALIDWIHQARLSAIAVVLNAGAFTHTSIALHDALKACEIPVVECHLSNPATRESFRHVSHVATAAKGSITGFGLMSYELAVEAAARLSAAR